ncbi:phage holin family protein [Demequina sp. NBRC 110053]|uniref:phage holin family protein n=1 Tax=Demequina sp. NBRC 110053 TaxID=1570342 RepID=UPI000A020BBD|nr:phage holin family protein [Demequina sp. NBRC 110053]
MASSYGKMFVNAILGAIAGQWIATIKSEVEVVKVELKYKSQRLGLGAALVVVAAVLGFFMTMVLIAAAVLGFSNVMEPWGAALLVAGILLVFVLIFALIGVRLIKKNKDLFPSASIERIKNSV